MHLVGDGDDLPGDQLDAGEADAHGDDTSLELHGKHPGITSSSPGTSTTKTKKPEDCSTLSTPSTTKETNTIDWNNDTTSTAKYKLTLSSGSATLAGKVTSGTFKKDKFTGTASFSPGAGQDCVGTPVTSVTISGSVQLT